MENMLGWRHLYNAAKWHFFKADGRSLCGKWMVLTQTVGEFGNNESPSNCKACARKVAALETVDG